MLCFALFVSTSMWADEALTTFTGFTATAGSKGVSSENPEGYTSLVDGKFTKPESGQQPDASVWTKWCTSSKSKPSNESTSCYWVDFNYSEVINVKKYILTTANDNATETGRNPKSWILKGKMGENDTWTTIASVTEDKVMQDVNYTDYEFDVTTPGDYKYFRFMVTATQGASCLQLAELRLKGTKATLLNGKGTEESPFEISTAEDWEKFTNWINNGSNATSYYKLMNDITLGSEQAPLETIVGVSTEKSFKGTFDGGKNTITVYMSRKEPYAALFGVIDGATIKDMTVKGTITSTDKYIAGFAAFSYNTNTKKASNFINCTSSVTIDGQVSGDISAGGFIGQSEKGTTNFTDCVFDGTISGKDENTEKCGGFMNYSGSSSCYINYTNCFMAGTINVKKNIATFQRGNATTTYTNCYYINNYSGKKPQGVAVGTSVPANGIAKQVTVATVDYYIPGGSVSGVSSYYTATGNAIPVEPTVQYDGNTLEKDKDYAISYTMKNTNDEYEKVKDVVDAGEYQVIVTGRGSYAGTEITNFEVVDVTTEWMNLQMAINEGGVVSLDQDYTASDKDIVLSINNTVTLDLNGHTISRALTEAKAAGNVISIQDGGNLTITDSSADKTGVITGGNNIGNGGGIINNGILTLKSGSIIGNSCIEGKVDGTSYYGTGGGIYNDGSKCEFYMEGGSVSKNTAQGGGAGIHGVSTKQFAISGGEITGNIAVNKGGGVRVKTTKATIANCTISYNKTTGDEQGNGGGILVEEKGVTLENVTISDNEAAMGGGGICVMSKASVTAKNVTITNNTANEGGCIYLSDNATYEMDGGDYSGNTCTAKSAMFFVSPKSTFKLDLEDNATNIVEDLDGCTPTSVTLTGRTLYKDNDWNTLCLPFDVDLEDDKSPLYGADARTLTEASFDDEGKLSFAFGNPVTKLVAGTPYIIKWANGDNLTSKELVFTGVTISKEEHNFTSTDGNVQFIGTTVYKTFDAENKNILLLGAKNKLYYPKADFTDPNNPVIPSIGACRAYFKLTDSSIYKVKAINMDFEEEDTDGINRLTPDLPPSRMGNSLPFMGPEPHSVAPLKTPVALLRRGEIYNLSGQRISKPQKGLNIINGKKVLY